MCFYNLTNLFFSTLPNDYEETLNNEIWGCVKFVGIPYDTVMSMPVYKRKDIIRRHNEYVEEENRKYGGGDNHENGEAINIYARMEQANKANRGY